MGPKLTALQANHHLHAGDLHAWRDRGHLTDRNLAVRNIKYAIVVFAKEMVMLGHICIVPSFLAIDRQSPQQTRARELLKRIVNGGKRNADTLALGMAVQGIGRNMMVPPMKQESSKFKPLPREPKSHTGKYDADVTRNAGTFAKFASPRFGFARGFSPPVIFCEVHGCGILSF
jgi:hypothetical protein